MPEPSQTLRAKSGQSQNPIFYLSIKSELKIQIGDNLFFHYTGVLKLNLKEKNVRQRGDWDT